MFTKKEKENHMNVQDLEILKQLEKSNNKSQRELAELSGCSLGKVNKSIKLLYEKGYIDEDNQVTLFGKKLFEDNQPENAIILAAGYGMRMVPINTEIPKGLLEVRASILIERIIEQLYEVGVKKITLVVGFMKERYEYLIDKYGITLKINMDYAIKNNLYSFEKAIEQLGNTYIVPCDIYCKENPFAKQELFSWYMVTDKKKISSDVRINRKRELIRVKNDEFGNDMLGIAYINKHDSVKVKEKVNEYCADGMHNNSFWEETLYENKKMIIHAKQVSGINNFEINTFEQLREADANSDNLNSETIALIAEVFHTKESFIKNITVLKKGMTNRSFSFMVENERYIMRIPGQGTEKLINREREYQVYKTIENIGICDEIYYINPDNGYKITKFIQNAKTCDANNWDEVSKCIAVLKEFHNKNLQVEHTFDLFEQLEFYESLWDGNSCYRDYQITKENIYRLKSYIENQDKQWTLTHIDANADNFLIWSDNDGKERINLIDWEYAGMQDAHLDIAMFAIYSMYNREQIDKLIDIYFENHCTYKNRIKIYAYVAIGGLIWSNWCEYKRQKGQEFGEYSIKQYRYAKEYSRIVLKKLEKETI